MDNDDKTKSKNIKKIFAYISLFGGVVIALVGLYFIGYLGFRKNSFTWIVIGNIVVGIGFFFVFLGNGFVQKYLNQERVICFACCQRLDPNKVRIEPDGRHKKTYYFIVKNICDCGNENTFRIGFSAISYDIAKEKLLKYLTKLYKQK